MTRSVSTPSGHRRWLGCCRDIPKETSHVDLAYYASVIFSPEYTPNTLNKSDSQPGQRRFKPTSLQLVCLLEVFGYAIYVSSVVNDNWFTDHHNITFGLWDFRKEGHHQTANHSHSRKHLNIVRGMMLVSVGLETIILVSLFCVAFVSRVWHTIHERIVTQCLVGDSMAIGIDFIIASWVEFVMRHSSEHLGLSFYGVVGNDVIGILCVVIMWLIVNSRDIEERKSEKTTDVNVISGLKFSETETAEERRQNYVRALLQYNYRYPLSRDQRSHLRTLLQIKVSHRASSCALDYQSYSYVLGHHLHEAITANRKQRNFLDPDSAREIDDASTSSLTLCAPSIPGDSTQ